MTKQYYEIDYPRREAMEALIKIIEGFAGSSEGTEDQRHHARMAAAHLHGLLDELENGEEE